LPSPSPESPLRYRTPMIFLRLALLPKGRIFPFEHKLRGIRCCAVSDSSVLLLCTSGDEAKSLPSKRFWLQKIAKHLYSLEQISAVSKTKPSPSCLAFTTPLPSKRFGYRKLPNTCTVLSKFLLQAKQNHQPSCLAFTTP
jgi:hypothetical protein